MLACRKSDLGQQLSGLVNDIGDRPVFPSDALQIKCIHPYLTSWDTF
jgi:hypothetical protein